MKRYLAALVAGALGLTAIAANAADTTGAVKTRPIKTQAGPVQGIVKGPVAEFLGIPYAAPPVGDLRWRPTQAPKPWTQTLQATQFANTCPQENRGVFAAPSNTEDCLYLNVFTPKTGAGHRPVMVWIYGGGLFSGESNDYDARRLAAKGDVVVVTINYRIGALGFLSHSAINGEGHPFANYGIMDQQFALHWVKRNIASFGGNPNNVTIFGQSGGATAVMANLVSPKSSGLFQRAINESGTHIAPMPQDAALKAGEAFATAAGCTDQSASCLRALPVEKVLTSQKANVALIAPDFPVVDGTIIPDTAFHAFSTGTFNHVPILTGLVRDEQAFFLPEVNGAPPLTADGYAHDIASFGAANVEKLTAKYPLAAYDSPSLADIAMQEGFKACTARQLDRAWSKYVPVYAYQFNDRTAPTYFRDLSYPMRAYHTSELQYLFVEFHGGQGTAKPLSAAQSKLSDDIIAYWSSFARDGVPKLPGGSGVPRWQRYAPAADNLQILDLPKPSVTRGYGAQFDCALWDSVVSY